MKIAGGKWRGRPLKTPQNMDVRPTSVRVRQSLFNILRHGRTGDRLTGAQVLDAFAGTGALALEAVSQGATHATCFDTSPAARAVLQANVASLSAEDQITVAPHDATNPPPRPPNTPPATLAFLDPPYAKNLAAPAITALDAAAWFAPDVLIVIESARDQPTPTATGFVQADHRTTGTTALTFLIRAEP